ncbi:UNVERIFIED_CONTAM: hypothetical protein Sangu_3213400 [Sesamum angustifolium]|uniref:Uncharacterized protein n=1 Tax=Sesamum angustifolium TaxID=2727405 RepID=A0AAW2JJQ2_9LAMI
MQKKNPTVLGILHTGQQAKPIQPAQGKRPTAADFLGRTGRRQQQQDFIGERLKGWQNSLKSTKTIDRNEEQH